MRHLLARLALVAAFVAVPVGAVAAPTSAGVSQCSTRGYQPNSAGRYTAAYTICASSHYPWRAIQTRIHCSNGATAYGNQITAPTVNGYPNLSKALCPFGTYALSWYYAYWY